MVRLSGTPTEFDALWKGVAGAALGVPALAAFAWLVWSGAPAWAPVPALMALALHRLIFWWRGDRPVRLELTDRLVLHDPKRGAEISVRPSEVHTATLHYRPLRDDRLEAIVVLTNRREVLFSVRLQVEPDVQLFPHDVDVEAMDQLLGGYAGVLKSVSGPGTRCRQVIDDPAGQALTWLRQNLHPAAWNRTAVRVWRGAEPPLDLFGHHGDPHDAMLILDGDGYELADDERRRTGTIMLMRSARSEREVTVARRFRIEDNNDEVPHETITLPLMLLELDSALTLAIPAQIAGLEGVEQPLNETLLHTHVAEGGAAVWHVLMRWPQAAWPTPLRRQAETIFGSSGDHRSPKHRASDKRHPSAP